MPEPYLKLADFEALQTEFETASPQDILKWATTVYEHELVVVTSFQPTGIATIHMLKDIQPDITIITLDTGFLFPETHAVIDEMVDRFDINLIRMQSALTVEQQERKYGEALWDTNPDKCCEIRKTRPLKSALLPYSAWLTGLRRDQSPSRAQTPIVSWDKRYGLVKFCPFANWTEDMIWTYISAYNLPYNTLHNQGYPSIGCTHCTHAVQEGDDPRAGRWVKFGKTECGIHVPLSNNAGAPNA